jgi:hypothetical protein
MFCVVTNISENILGKRTWEEKTLGKSLGTQQSNVIINEHLEACVIDKIESQLSPNILVCEACLWDSPRRVYQYAIDDLTPTRDHINWLAIQYCVLELPYLGGRFRFCAKRIASLKTERC